MYVWAFDPSCFRETANIENPPKSSFQVATESNGEDIFFVQESTILPAVSLNNAKNISLPFTLSGIDMDPSITDLDPKSGVQIDPYRLTQGDIIFTIDLSTVHPPHTLRPVIEYSADTNVNFALSEDGQKYFTAARSSIEDFAFRYIRVTFEKVKVQSTPTIVRDIAFFENTNTRYLVTPKSGVRITAYRWLVCDTAGYTIPTPSETTPTSSGYTQIQFGQNALYKNDYDNDGIANTDDTCPYTSNPHQEDRNYDGIGDACSDDDHDGLVWAHDNCPTVANPDQKDTNANGIGDACEFDTDGDGIPDGMDNAIHMKNPDQKDTDMDSIGDIIDNCNLYNPDQLDLDKNGIGDACDRETSYKKNNDMDVDGILNMTDNCPTVANPDQKDTDGDGIGDACDNCLSLKNPDQADADKNNKGDMCEDQDHDGIDGWRDNCPTLSNPDQTDADNNGIGNACTDTDGDGVFDSLDNCPTISNPDQKDIDADHIGDACDTHDDRFLESNRYLFMGLIWVFALIFIGVIIFLLLKLR